MELLDAEGNLFGLVNAVDAGAVLLVGLLVVGSVAVVAVPRDQPAAGVLVQQVVVEGETAPSTAAAISTGPVPTAGVVAVENVSTSPVDGNVTVLAAVRLRVGQTADGLTTFNGTRLYIGRELTLELTAGTFTGVVVEAFEPFRMQATPTASPTRVPTPSPSPTPTTLPTPTATPPSTSTPTATRTPTATPSPTPTPTASPAPRTASPTPGPAGPSTHLVTVVAVTSEETAAAIEGGAVPTRDIVAVRGRTTERVDDGVRVELVVELAVDRTADGAVLFRGVELVAGQRLVLDLGDVVLEGEVTAL